MHYDLVSDVWVMGTGMTSVVFVVTGSAVDYDYDYRCGYDSLFSFRRPLNDSDCGCRCDYDSLHASWRHRSCQHRFLELRLC